MGELRATSGSTQSGSLHSSERLPGEVGVATAKGAYQLEALRDWDHLTES